MGLVYNKELVCKFGKNERKYGNRYGKHEPQCAGGVPYINVEDCKQYPM